VTGFRKLDEVELVRSKVFRVVRSRFTAPDGAEFERTFVRHPGAVAVVPLHDDGTVTLVRQYRPALDVDLLELPAGTCDVDGEDGAVTAERELVEEAGLSAGHLEHLTTFHNAPGMSDEAIAVFLATDLRPVDHDRQSAEEHHMTTERIGLGEVVDMIGDGRITDAKTIIGVTLVADRRA
jgi:ADP-ribose pyrophosphatase